MDSQSKIKYVICPATIYLDEGKSIYFGVDNLIERYDVNISDCIVLDYDDPDYVRKYRFFIDCGYIFLHPRSNGDYSWLKKDLRINPRCTLGV